MVRISLKKQINYLRTLLKFLKLRTMKVWILRIIMYKQFLCFNIINLFSKDVDLLSHSKFGVSYFIAPILYDAHTNWWRTTHITCSIVYIQLFISPSMCAFVCGNAEYHKLLMHRPHYLNAYSSNQTNVIGQQFILNGHG